MFLINSNKPISIQGKYFFLIYFREIILLFKELYETSSRLGTDVIQRKPTYFIPKIVEQALTNMNQSGASAQAKKISEAKRSFTSLLEVLNAKYISEYKKDSEKRVSFFYSDFSPVDGCIKKEKVPLKDMLSLVQTNLLKLYFELKEKDKIYSFFLQNN